MKIYIIINENGGWDNFSMVKIETCICESKADAINIEQKYYDELNENENKMNTRRPMRTSEQVKNEASEYKDNNKIAIKEKNKQYRTANKERISTRAAEIIHCEVCDCYHRKGDIAKHNKTTKHQNNINKIKD